MLPATAKLNRRQFLKLSSGSTAALILGFNWSLASCSESQESRSTFIPNAYLRIDHNGAVTIVMPRSEMGQKIFTSLPMILAEELEADWKKIRVVQGDLDQKFGSQTTGGSASVRTQYDIMRKAGATARTMLIQAAAEKWNVAETRCFAAAGAVHIKAGHQSLKYGSLVALAAALPVPHDVTLKDPADFRIIGKTHNSIDGLSKIDGSLKYGYDFHLPGMLTAVIARIPRYGASLKQVDDSASLLVPGVVEVVPVSAGVAVIAQNTSAALEGRKKLKLTWNKGQHETLSSQAIFKELHDALRQPGEIIRKDGDPSQARKAAARKLDLTFELPFLDHAPQEPNNCVAHIHEDICEVWAPTQNPGSAFRAASGVTGFKDTQIKIHTLRMGGAFGRRLQSDYVKDAVEVAQHIDVPVKVVRTRSEDIKNGFYRPATVHQVSVRLDASDKPLLWEHHLSGPANGWAPIITGGADELAYAIPHQQVSYVMTELPIPMGAWRSVAHTQNGFVNESMIDEIACSTGRDPLTFRRELLKNEPRHLGVLDLAADRSGWGSKLPEGQARGIAVHYSFQSYVAVVAEISLSTRGKLKVERITAAIDCGTVINPDGVHAQLEGGVIMGLTAALYGEITHKNGRVQQSNFHNYPLLTMAEMPVISTYIVKSTEPPTGAGEPPVPPTPPALMNAIAALTGKRITRLPLKNQLS